MYRGLQDLEDLELYLGAGNTNDHDEFSIHFSRQIYKRLWYLKSDRRDCAWHCRRTFHRCRLLLQQRLPLSAGRWLCKASCTPAPSHQAACLCCVKEQPLDWTFDASVALVLSAQFDPERLVEPMFLPIVFTSHNLMSRNLLDQTLQLACDTGQSRLE